MINNQPISFKANLRFEPREALMRFRDAKYINFEDNAQNIVKADEFVTEFIASCTGGGLTGRNTSGGFHIWDNKENTKSITKIIDKILENVENPSEGLVIGAKDIDWCKSSMTNFLKIRNAMKKRVKNLSIFQTIKSKLGVVHCGYSAKENCWIISCEERGLRNNDFSSKVNNVEELKAFFGKISIAKNDKLFIQGKEISIQDCPEIFQT